MGIAILARAALETARISVPTIIDAIFGRTSYAACDERLDGWSRRLLEQAGVELEIRGQHHLQERTSYVVMSNHQSLYDIPVVFQALRVPLRMVAKRELFKIPIMGQAMSDSGFIEIDRSNRRRAVEQLKTARSRIVDNHLSVWIAPEGTRSDDGSLGPFKSGGFYLALATQVPILPLTVDGTIRIHSPKAKRVVKGQKVTVTIHAPIDVAQYDRPRMRELMSKVHEQIAEGLSSRTEP